MAVEAHLVSYASAHGRVAGDNPARMQCCCCCTLHVGPAQARTSTSCLGAPTNARRATRRSWWLATGAGVESATNHGTAPTCARPPTCRLQRSPLVPTHALHAKLSRPWIGSLLSCFCSCICLEVVTTGFSLYVSCFSPVAVYAPHIFAIPSCFGSLSLLCLFRSLSFSLVVCVSPLHLQSSPDFTCFSLDLFPFF